MKKLVLTALCALAFGACGDDGGGSGTVTLTPDGGGNGDGGNTAACNPVTQAGCDAGQKCAQLVSSEEPFLATTACVPDGEVTAGGACVRGEAGVNGYDDCVAGYDCLRGECVQICTSAGGDTCRATPDPGFGMGSYCTLYADLFSDEIGLCVPGCNPTDDSVDVDKVVTNANCDDGNGCYLNIGRGVAACAGTPADAVTVTQGNECYGPGPGSCFLNGCASGYAPVVPNALTGATSNNCARYCTPNDNYLLINDTKTPNPTGDLNKCGTAELVAAGSAALPTHECRYIQSFYSDAGENPPSQGMCVPVDPWHNCNDNFEWEGLLAAVTGAADPAAANTAFNNFCYGEPTPPDTAELGNECLGLRFGCVSLATQEPLFTALADPAAGPLPAMTADKVDTWLKRRLKTANQATSK